MMKLLANRIKRDGAIAATPCIFQAAGEMLIWARFCWVDRNPLSGVSTLQLKTRITTKIIDKPAVTAAGVKWSNFERGFSDRPHTGQRPYSESGLSHPGWTLGLSGTCSSIHRRADVFSDLF